MLELPKCVFKGIAGTHTCMINKCSLKLPSSIKTNYVNTILLNAKGTSKKKKNPERKDPFSSSQFETSSFILNILLH